METTIQRHITLMGAPVDCGAGLKGCSMGPASLRIAGIENALCELGYDVEDIGDVEAERVLEDRPGCTGAALNLASVAGWTRSIKPIAEKLMRAETIPIFMGGDHSISMGSVSGAAQFAQSIERPLFVLWLDAHPDFNTFNTSNSGNIHGTPVAYFCGLEGFDALLGRPLDAIVCPENVSMLGIRSVDGKERRLLEHYKIEVNDISQMDEFGVVKLLRPFLEKVQSANGLLHVSLDVDFLDPGIAPAVGTCVDGGATYREAHLIMEMLHESGLLTSLDIVELNPFLDEKGRTAKLIVELVASLFGRTIMGHRRNNFQLENSMNQTQTQILGTHSYAN